MAISHSQSLHCSFMENSLSSIGEALKTINSIKFGRDITSQNGCFLLQKGCIFFRKHRTTAYLLVCMHVVATLLDIK